jgi:hypothetical protein
MPAIVSGFFELILPILLFDIVDDNILGLLFNFDEPAQEIIKYRILDQMKDLGYENHNSIQNMGSLGLLCYIYLIRVALFYTVVKLSVRFGKCKKT